MASFLSLGNARMVERYCHLNPAVDKAILSRLIASRCSSFRWSGADLFSVTNNRGKRQMIVVETNSCPSGQKSMPPMPPTPHAQDEHDDGYHRIIRVQTATTAEHSQHQPAASLRAALLLLSSLCRRASSSC